MKKSILLLYIFVTSGIIAQNPNFILFDHTNAPFVNDSITWVDVDANNIKWIGTRNGLYSFNNNIWSVYNTSNSNIPDNRIDKFKIAHDNSLWFLNHGKGFIKFKNNVFTLFNQNNLPLLPTDSLVGLTIDSNDVFLWSNSKGIVKFNSLNNVVDTINLSNSCLNKIGSLVTHGNHMIYGLTIDAMPIMMQPQTFTDSVQTVNDFRIHNTTGTPISYCFLDFFNTCNYIKVMTDRFGNRYEISIAPPNSTLPTQSIKTYDINNNLLSNFSYLQSPDEQIATNSHGVYRLNTAGLDYFSGTIFSTSTNFTYHAMNSIIPSATIINFEIDTLNNVWIATAAGLVGYNDLGVITKVDITTINNISIYPNPTKDVLNIDISTTIDVTKELIVKITDVLGKELLFTDYQTQINISHFETGIYFVSIMQGDKTLVTKKVVKQ